MEQDVSVSARRMVAVQLPESTLSHNQYALRRNRPGVGAAEANGGRTSGGGGNGGGWLDAPESVLTRGAETDSSKTPRTLAAAKVAAAPPPPPPLQTPLPRRLGWGGAAQRGSIEGHAARSEGRGAW